MTIEQLTPRQIREREFFDEEFGEEWEGKINVDVFADQKNMVRGIPIGSVLIS